GDAQIYLALARSVHEGQDVDDILRFHVVIGGNVLIATKPTDELDLYDQARLAAPGTIVEEAALRRSVAICVDKGMLD
ncbi:hypothetical protein ACCT04_37250, partial [Rhizobium ruizarguesonis]